jgi:hypothetical protein
MAAAYTPVCHNFRVEHFGTPVRAATFTPDKLEGAHPVTLACATAAWAGTAFVFGSIPWWENPKVKPWVKVAAGVAVGGMFATVLSSGLSK